MKILRHMWLVIIIGLGLFSKSYATIHRETTLEIITTPIAPEIAANRPFDNCLTAGSTPQDPSVDFLFDYGVFQESRRLIEHACHATTESSLNMLTEQERDHGYTVGDNWFAASPAPLASFRQGFKVTKYTLQKLHESGVPEQLLRQLEQMEGQQFVERDLFWATVEQYADAPSSDGASVLDEAASLDAAASFDAEALKEYQSIIVEHATIAVENISFSHETMSGNSSSVYLSQNSLKNKEAWESLLYYPKAFKKNVSSERPKTSPPRTPYQVEDEISIFNLRNLIKKWGIPKPSTLLLIGLGLYCLLALFSKRH